MSRLRQPSITHWRAGIVDRTYSDQHAKRWLQLFLKPTFTPLTPPNVRAGCVSSWGTTIPRRCLTSGPGPPMGAWRTRLSGAPAEAARPGACQELLCGGFGAHASVLFDAGPLGPMHGRSGAAGRTCFDCKGYGPYGAKHWASLPTPGLCSDCLRSLTHDGHTLCDS
jgi:hypothetical protein